MFNLRSWIEWSDTAPDPDTVDCIEAEYVDERGRLAYAQVRQYHYADDRGSVWGHSTGDWREGTYKTHHPKYSRWRFIGPLVPSKEAQGKSIIVWRWLDAPGELRRFSRHGGDEDYVALVPKDMEPPSWMDSGTSFGCCDVSSHDYEDGRTVLIGAHA